jgi:hypothetical protein
MSALVYSGERNGSIILKLVMAIVSCVAFADYDNPVESGLSSTKSDHVAVFSSHVFIPQSDQRNNT